jgi:hypothetical protein
MVRQVLLLTSFLVLFGCSREVDDALPVADADTAAAEYVRIAVTAVTEETLPEPVSEPVDPVAELPAGRVYSLASVAELTELTVSGQMVFAMLCTSPESLPCVLARERFAAVADTAGDWLRFVQADLGLTAVAPIEGQYMLTTVPTVLVFTNGCEAGRIEGLCTAGELLAHVNALAN